MAYEPKDIRNIALVGHGGSGKTTLADAMLFKAKASNRFGKVNDGTSLSDYDPEEKERKISIDLAILHCGWKGTEIQILDTPGFADFVGAAVNGLSVAETAVFTVSAVAGIEVNTRKLWKMASDRGLPRIIVITKLDADNAKYAETLRKIQDAFGTFCKPVVLAKGEAKSFSGVVDLVTLKDAPADLKAEAEKRAAELREAAVEADDALLERYLEGKPVSIEEAEGALAKSILLGKMVPVLAVSSDKDIGVTELMDFIARYAPSPVSAKPRAAGDGKTVALNPEGPFTAQVFKVVIDPFVGRLSYFRVFSGAVDPGKPLHNASRQEDLRIGGFSRPQGKDLETVTRIVTGDIVTVAKVENVAIGDTLVQDPATSVVLPAFTYPTPMVSLAVEPKSRGDEAKISGSLAKIVEEDKTFRVTRDQQTGELVTTGMGDLHLDVVLARLKRRFALEVTTKEPKIPYRETITGKGDANYRHKKQTGGAGQFAEVWLRIEPLERGKGFEFHNEVKGGAISQQYIPSIEKGIKQMLERGAYGGYPMVDIRAAVYYGKEHPVDSKDIAFQVAGRECFKLACQQARMVLLEPIVTIEITVPSKYIGGITGDLNSRRGRILGVDVAEGGDTQSVKAMIPLAEISRYSTELRSITGGEGYYTLEFSHYDIVPHKNAEAVVARSKPQAKTEEE